MLYVNISFKFRHKFHKKKHVFFFLHQFNAYLYQIKQTN